MLNVQTKRRWRKQTELSNVKSDGTLNVTSFSKDE